MHRLFRRAWRFGGLAGLMLLLLTGLAGVASQVHAADPNGGLFLDLYPENDEVPYACVGKSVDGYFITGVEQKEPTADDPLASLTPPEIHVMTLTPYVGSLSPHSWTVNSMSASRRFSYLPKQAGDEHLSFTALVPDSNLPQVTKEASFPVIYCRYRVSIHSEIRNIQTANGSVDTRIFYDGEGNFDVSRKDKSSEWTIKGYGTTTFEAYSDGTEHGVTCTSTGPGKGSGTFSIEGNGDPTSTLNLTFRFSDAGSSVPQTCTKEKHTGPGMVRYVAWLPSGKSDGELADLEFLPKGDNKDLDLGEFNDRRWVEGANSGTMLISVIPVTK